jgi:hypothetical protein
MRTDVGVVMAVILGQPFAFGQGVDLLDVEQIVAQTPVEAFDVRVSRGVLGGMKAVWNPHCLASNCGPLSERIKLGTLYCSTGLSSTVTMSSDPRLAIDFQSEFHLGEFTNQRPPLQAKPGAGLVKSTVVAPNMIAMSGFGTAGPVLATV